MSDTEKILTAESTVGAWLDHATGGAALRKLLTEAGTDEQALAPVRQFSLRALADLSPELTPDIVDDLVRQANGGVIPAEDEATEAAWRERIVPGRFEGKTVIVTGAASGIGRATAARLAREGARVIAADITADKLAELGTEFSDMVTVAGDITKSADVERIVAAAGSRIDGLANIAGIVDDFAPIHEVTDAMWERVFRVNVDGLFQLTRAVVPAMLEAGRGSIVNIASEAALRGSAAGVAYTASKHAVVGITRSTAFMYAPRGIRVNAVAPGGVATGINPGQMSEFGKDRTSSFVALIPPIATAAQLAASVTFLLSDDGVNLNGAILPSDGGWSVQ